MDKTLVGLVAAIGALATVSPVQADASSRLSTAMEATSFRDLLRPIPNASALLEIADAQESVSPQEGVQLAQYDYYYHHHHHHHRRHYYHHHHHHHHHHYY